MCSTYPFDFPQSSRDFVELEKLRAHNELDAGLAASPSKFTPFARNYVCRVVATFGTQALSLISCGKWGLDRLEREVEEFLRLEAINCEALLSPHRLGWITPFGGLTFEEARKIKSLTPWREYRTLLLTSLTMLESSEETEGDCISNRDWFEKVQALYLSAHKKELTQAILSKEAGYETHSRTEVKNWLAGKPRTGSANGNISAALKRIEGKLR